MNNTESQVSFRDPWGQLLLIEGRVFRVVNREGQAHLYPFLNSACAKNQINLGQLVSSDLLSSCDSLPKNLKNKFGIDEDEEDYLFVEHEAIPFRTYPSEWAPEMLHCAGMLTLDLMEAALSEGFGLKDATPFNILFRGPNPVFVDLLSFEKRDPTDMIWLAQAQFLRTFILPLIANRHFGLPMRDVFLSRRDGLEPKEMFEFAGMLKKFTPDFLFSVSIPTWLERSDRDSAIRNKSRSTDPEKSEFILRHSIRRLRKKLIRLEPKSNKRTTWSNYMGELSYNDDDFHKKEQFVTEALAKHAPKVVLDVGCNTGNFSLLAALQGASVIAIDPDPAVIGEVWKQARKQNLDIVPLVQNLAYPTPGLGWRNQEYSPFLERVSKKSDMVLMLAVIHHLMITDGVPLPSIIDMAAELTRDALIIEYVHPTDSMFKQLCRGRDDLHAGLNELAFENECSRHFNIDSKLAVKGGDRTLYLMTLK